jgi:hypothetical protein
VHWNVTNNWLLVTQPLEFEFGFHAPARVVCSERIVSGHDVLLVFMRGSASAARRTAGK